MYYTHDFRDGGRVVLVDPPTEPAVTLAAAKAAMGITGTSQDAQVTAAIAMASDALDPASAGWLGRALRTQQWELQLRTFSDYRGGARINPRQAPQAHRVSLPYPPLQSVDSVKYLDVNGVDQTLVLNTDYRILGQGEPYAKACIAPLYQQSWPTTRVDDASVRIRFTCGYDEDDARKMPQALKSAIVLGARALMSVMARDMTLFEDRVEGIGWKRYQSNPAAAEIVTKAIAGLLNNLQIA